MSEIRVLVSVSDEHLDDFDQVVERSRKAGLKVKSTMRQSGIVTGTIDSTRISDLRQVRGVQEVEPDREVRIPPPDSDIQ
ncbi:MAG: ketohydroxyglutarate aldolase [Longimicrobiales bacterium]